MVALSVQVEKQLGNFALSVDFTVESGLTVLFGPSGCGKSSTLSAVAGLIKPEQGQITLAGEVFFDARLGINLSTQARQVGYVFQNYALFPHLDVRRNICFGIDGTPPEQQRERLQELLTLLRLEGLADRLPTQLSGGQQQRVAIARALAPRPRLLLLDEPFSALDSELREELRGELRRLQQRLDLPILMVTHTRSEALQLADTVVRLSEGRVVAVGPAVEVLALKNWSATTGFSW